MGDWSDSRLPQGWNWTFVLWAIAPVFGVSSLIAARPAARPDDLAMRGGAIIIWGMAEEGVGSLELAIRLNPNHPVWYTWFHGAALYGVSRFEDAARVLQAVAVHTVVSRLYLAASLHRLGRQAEARSELVSAQEELPGLSVAMLEQMESYRDPSDQARLSDALRATGLPAS